MATVLDDKLVLRLRSEDRANFERRCAMFPVNHTDMLREMITAFNEGRLRITVPKSKPLLLKGIHDVD